MMKIIGMWVAYVIFMMVLLIIGIAARIHAEEKNHRRFEQEKDN